MLFYNFHQYSTEYIIEWTKMSDPNSSQKGNIERGWQVVPTELALAGDFFRVGVGR